jgi:hypothetical protein
LVSATVRGCPRVEVLHEPLDRPALAGGVAALEDDDVLGPHVLGPVLELQQLDLEEVLLLLVGVPVVHLVVRVVLAPGLDRPAVGPDEQRVLALAALDAVPLGLELVDVLPQAHLAHRLIHESHAAILACRLLDVHHGAGRSAGGRTTLVDGLQAELRCRSDDRRAEGGAGPVGANVEP